MSTSAHIGASIRIKGEVTASEPLTIAGNIDGSVEVQGHAVTIMESGRLTATVQADAIVIAGNVSGLLNAVTRVSVRDTAVIDGDISAPAVSLAEGAIVHGRIETAGRKESLKLAS
jgi:cytoskeletal protein CcmA (bactofilin family)